MAYQVARGDILLAILTALNHLRSPIRYDPENFTTRSYQIFDNYSVEDPRIFSIVCNFAIYGMPDVPKQNHYERRIR